MLIPTIDLVKLSDIWTTTIQVRLVYHTAAEFGRLFNKPVTEFQLMLDVDSPNPANPSLRQTEHFVVVNIPDANIAAGDILAGNCQS